MCAIEANCHLFNIITISNVILIADSCLAINQFERITSCLCLGSNVTYECSVSGTGGTVWQGTLFNLCSSDRIFLRHSQFISGSSITRTCDNGTQIIGSTIGVISNSYISQLTATISHTSNHKTVQCYHDTGFSTDLIGTNQISFLNGII